MAVLKQVAHDFPYFQVAHVLLTKCLYNEQHYEYEKQLKHTALMVPDRAVLFRYIHGIVAEEGVSQAQTSLPQAAADEPINETSVLEPVEAVIEPIPLVEEPAITLAPVTEVVETAIETSDLEPIDSPIEVSPIIETSSVADVESTALTHSTGTEMHSFAEWLQLQIQNPVDLRANRVELNADIALDEPLEVPDEPTMRLQPIENETETTVELEIEEVEAPRATEPDKLVTPSEREIRIEIQQQVERSNINDFESILDKFIRENPRISRGKAEFYNPVNMAKQSVEEDDELVTETLANVYYKQGHHKKAIRAYEKLCLIYPHKLTYFAGLIQKIKTEIKD